MNIRMAPHRRLRDVAQHAVRTEMVSKAMALFVDQGFDETTVDQIAAAVGVSSRSIFRYFSSKEEMVVGDMLQLGRDIAAALESRPLDESPWEALRRAFDEPLEALRHDGGAGL